MYRDSAFVPTIGVGHALTRSELYSGKTDVGGWKWRDGLTAEQVDAVLDHDVQQARDAVLRLVTVPLTPNQLDALTSFVFNIGAAAFARSTLLKRLNEGKYDAVPDQMRRWVYAAGVVSPGLVKRREEEIKLWNGEVSQSA